MSTITELIEKQLEREIAASYEPGFANPITVASIQKITAWVPVSIESLVDAGDTDPAVLAQYAEHEARRKAAWKTLPLRRRAWIRWYSWKIAMRERIHDRLFPEFRRDWDDE